MTSHTKAIPNHYTACEEYRGYVVAVNNGWYKGFRNGEPMIGIGPELTRAGIRRAIELVKS